MRSVVLTAGLIVLSASRLPAQVRSVAAASYAESFDAVTAPALPSGWTAVNEIGTGALWTTTTTTPDTAPNAAFIPDGDEVADKRLDSPAIPIQTSAAYLSFRQLVNLKLDNFDFPPVDVSAGVLEISIDGSVFRDILDVGGSFVYGGYDPSFIIPPADNPLHGRLAWGGLGSGYFTTEVRLPSQAIGHPVVLRWRLGTCTAFGNDGTGWWIDSIQICDGYPCDASPLPDGVDLDTDGNHVLDPGETVNVVTTILNGGAPSPGYVGGILSFAGHAGATYTIVDGSADYGPLSADSPASCASTGNCYALAVDNPAVRPLTHWDAQFVEEITGGEKFTRALHIGGSFADTPSSNLFYPAIETIFHHLVTAGCTPTTYCPDGAALREQMAVFLLKSKYGPSHVPPPATGIFADVPASDPFAPWIEELYTLGITAGCRTAPLRFCPLDPELRDQMAVFLLKTSQGPAYTPPHCQGVFSDVPCPSLFADWIEDLHARQITAGCHDGSEYCPVQPNTRGEMAVFLTRTFGLTLYGP